jgi:hypothetical protein
MNANTRIQLQDIKTLKNMQILVRDQNFEKEKSGILKSLKESSAVNKICQKKWSWRLMG